ncbi:MAG TPA: NAD(P)-binding domain-containing protein [Thermoleophilaceae bacterium]
MSDAHETVVVGGGQAGLSVSHELAAAGVPHVVLERGQVGQTWRGRWDSFCLVTPNWSVQLPGHHYDGDDPDGFMLRDEIVHYLQRYAASFEAPVREGVEVTVLRPGRDGRLLLETSDGEIEARNVILSTGAYQRPNRPAGAASLPPDLLQIDVEEYRNPDELPAGAVLVVGSGQSGCQISEELHLAGRDVFLACGRAGWGPRRLNGHDTVWWLRESGSFDDRVEDLPEPGARLWGNIQATGHDGGHDLHYRTLHAMGVTLVGHFLGADDRDALFAPDLQASIAWGDQRHAKVIGDFRDHAATAGLPWEDLDPAQPVDAEPLERLPLGELGAVVFTSGFRPDYESWVDFPGAFDELGFPLHTDGASTAVPGLYFAGVHFLRKRKSSLLIGVGEDAAIVAGQIAGR